MYLKNLTVFGFKSFADKTALNFQPGISAIVGPNGCGKSNVADAIRWVLGEQSAKALRGGEMADVVFSGTETRKPLGMAEVSLTLGGVDAEHLKAVGVELPFDEVTVTRRVFRDGGSEYFLNKVPCRLRDIQQLFMGTGMGRASYSIMAQGNITQILSSKPEDRRLVFEEAAGITRFKAQKKEALKKLENTEQNLLRVADLIREVKRQIGSLQRQAGKARRYKQYQAELQQLDTQLARHRFDLLQGEIGQRQERVDRLKLELEISTENLQRVENEIGELRKQLSELEQAVGASQKRGLELKAESELHENRVQYNHERLKELASQQEKALTDIALGEERRLATQQELAAVVERLAAASTALETRKEELQQRRAAVQNLENELRQAQEAVRQAQTEAFSLGQQLSRSRNEINTLDIQKQGNAIRLEKLSAERIQLEEERAKLEERLAEFVRQAEAQKQDAEVRRLTVEQTQARLRELQQELSATSQELDGLLRQQAEKRSRLNVLEQLQASHEGFGAGALAVLKNSQSVVGTLIDRIRVPGQYVAAVEAALGHHLQLVLTEAPDSAMQILGQLQANRQGRASIASLGLLTPAPAPEGGLVADSIPALSGGVAALSVVQADETVARLLASLLGRTAIVADLATATSLFRETNGAWDFVTEQGEVLTRGGVYTGGALNGSGKAPSSILGRKNQIEELTAQLAALQEQIAEGSRRKGALQTEQTALQARLQEAQRELRAQEVAIATRQGEFNALQNAQRVLGQKVQNVTYEAQTLSAQVAEGEAKRQVLATRLAELETREAEVQQRLATAGQSLESLRQQRDQASASLTETKVAFAAEEQMFTSLRNQRAPLEQRVQELGQLAEARRRDIENCAQRKGQAESEIAESMGRIQALSHEREQEGLKHAEWLRQREEAGLNVGTREEDLKERRRRHEAHQQERSGLEIELAQKHAAAQHLRDSVLQKYQLRIEDVRSECIQITYAADGPAKVVVVTPEEMAAAGAATNWEAVAEQVAALQQRIEEMGAINLVAIQEYEETEQRHQFLTAQHDDLVKAKEQLLEVINRVNGQTREMFIETFTKIRENFRNMFVEIFGGGKADLQLVDEGDVLESGIEIVARPPGKQLQSITLLSGGEQTMTAVALLFAIYQVRPSPFCILDELDAPLDESNINRFTAILQRFLAHSQFVIITHNKRTIAMADVLYGITMEERGVSKIVSVKFRKSDEEETGEAGSSAAAAGENGGQETVPREDTDRAEASSEIAASLAE